MTHIPDTDGLPPLPAQGASLDEVLHWSVAVAVRAPSKHNAQPWWFDIADGAVEIHLDGSRAMPVSDPHGREMVIGCGAALYTLRLAMRCAGREPMAVTFPEGRGFSVVARVTAGGSARPTLDDLAMLSSVPLRHTDRGPLDAGALASDVPFVLQRCAEREGATLQILAAPGLQHTLADLVARADRAESTDPAFDTELRSWLRVRASATVGIPLDARGPGAAGAYRAKFVQRDFDVTGAVHRDRAREIVDDPLPAVLWTDGDRPDDWLRAGQALMAVLLRATEAGVGASFLNQPLEIPSLRAALRQDLALPGFPQMILRLGIGHGGAPTPRRPVDEVTGVPAPQR